MKIHEYQAKELFKKYDVPIPEGRVAYSSDEAVGIAKSLAGYPVVVKAQIHAGGRGKGGGVKLAQSESEVQNVADQIIGMELVTHQTGPQGRRKSSRRSGPARPIRRFGDVPRRVAGSPGSGLAAVCAADVTVPIEATNNPSVLGYGHE